MGKYDEEIDDILDCFGIVLRFFNYDKVKEKVVKILDKLIQDKCDDCERVYVDDCSEPTINESRD